MAAQQNGASVFFAQFVDRMSEALLSQVLASRRVQGQRVAKPAIVNIAEPERDQAQADAALPRFAEQD